MKSLVTLVSLILCLNVVSAQKRLSKEISTKTFDITSFSALNVSDDFKVNITFSPTAEPIVVRANQNLMEFVNVSLDGNTLVLNVNSNNVSNWWTGKEVLEADIVIPMIKALTISGDAVVNASGTLETSSLSLNVKSDGVFKGTIDVDTLTLNGKSDAEIFLSGTASTMNAALKSDAELHSKDFTVGDLVINMASDAEARINVTKSLDAYATGDSELTYSGNPKIIRQKATGDAEINSRG